MSHSDRDVQLAPNNVTISMKTLQRCTDTSPLPVRYGMYCVNVLGKHNREQRSYE